MDTIEIISDKPTTDIKTSNYFQIVFSKSVIDTYINSQIELFIQFTLIEFLCNHKIIKNKIPHLQSLIILKPGALTYTVIFKYNLVLYHYYTKIIYDALCDFFEEHIQTQFGSIVYVLIPSTEGLLVKSRLDI